MPKPGRKRRAARRARERQAKAEAAANVKSPNAQPDSEHAGGQGEVTTASEILLIEQAINNEWPITPQHRKAVVGKLTGVLAGSADPRAIVAASRTLLAADKVNIDREKLEQAERHHQDGTTITIETAEQRRSRLLAIAERIGVGGMVIDAAQDTAGVYHPATNGSHKNGSNGSH